ncbi:hypothetical protein OSTOST_19245 [Ostertagia ostertagi]
MSRAVLSSAKQRLTRHLNDITHIISECSQYDEAWDFPKAQKELYVFTHTHHKLVSTIVTKLETKLEGITKIYEETLSRISDTEPPNENVIKEFENYWEERKGEELLESARALIQKLEIRLMELETQEMHVSYADEFDVRTRMRDDTSLSFTQIPQTSFSQPLSDIMQAPRPLGIPPHWYRKELRIPDFDGNPTEFEAFWEIFSELVHKQPYSDIEKLTILLDKCKREQEP